MEPQSERVRKTYKYRLKPTPTQQQALEAVVQRCCTLYTTALEQRTPWWDRGQGRSAGYYQQRAELPDRKNACFSCAGVPAQLLPPAGRETGIDLGLMVILITADEQAIDNLRHYRKAEKQLARAQGRASHPRKGSHRRREAVALLKRNHQQVQRQRRDVQHEVALALLRRYGTVYLEDLRVANLVRNPSLARSISDAGWAPFRTIIAGKAAYAGRRVLAVPPAYTSQDCSGCGERVLNSLSVRTHVCPRCGLVMDRDANAALNSLRAGQALQALTWADRPSVA